MKGAQEYLWMKDTMHLNEEFWENRLKTIQYKCSLVNKYNETLQWHMKLQKLSSTVQTLIW